MRAPIHARAPVLGRVRVLCLVRDHGLGLRGIAGGVILTSLRGMEGTAEEVEVGLGLVGEVGGEVDGVGIAKHPGLVHHLAGVPDPHAGGRRATNVEDTEDAERGLPHTLCVLVAHGRDLILVPAPALHVPARGRVPCLTPPTRGTVGAGAGVARVLVLRVVEGGAIAKMIFGTAVAGRGHQGSSCLCFQYTRFVHFPRVTCSTVPPPPSQLFLFSLPGINSRP